MKFNQTTSRRTQPGKTKSRQKGAFAIEFAIVGVLFGVLLVFAQDMIIKLSMKGKLDRLSYSAVSIIRERTQLYNEVQALSQDGNDADLIYEVIRDSLSRTTGSFDSTKFGMLIEVQTYSTITNDPYPLDVFTRGSQNCAVEQTLDQIESVLSVTTTWENKTPLYRVTLCYETDNLVAGMLDGGFTTVSSTSVSLGR